MPDRFATSASAIRPTPDTQLSRFHWDRLANWVVLRHPRMAPPMSGGGHWRRGSTLANVIVAG